ncbi:OmpA family protein [Nocardioides cynanchi]|uniref:OmpA family protein n=1 Tax=Nocardioides cynanchi TaxID=2558918 RepID=UPI001246FC2E|nr:OmpA family protein [Nocardioides cynanchi]
MIPESPGTRLLDALRAGDDKAVVAAVSQSTTVTAENMPWACRGPDEIETMLREARERFPGLTFESSARHVGFGIVIEEARVRDAAAEAEAGAAAAGDTAPQVGDGDGDGESGTPEQDTSLHPMWDAPAKTTHLGLSVWRDRVEPDEPATPLNMPVRLTVKHDDLQVHEVTLSFPAALLKRALGLHVDPFEMSLSEIQSAFIAPVGAGFTTHRLARPELALVTPPPAEAPAAAAPVEEPPRRRRRVLVPLLLALLALAAGGGWWVVQGSTGNDVASPPATSTTPTAPPTTPSASPSVQVSPTKEPSQPVRSRKPNVTLRSDLAFGFNSALLSGAAKGAIAQVADQVQKAHLHGTIYVDGYTDNIGSASYGRVLSQQRADAVAAYLRSRLGNAPVTVVPVGHGETHPIASNATTAGQKQNRRVTITLPKP